MLPAFLGFCPNERAFQKEMKSHKMEKDGVQYLTSDATTHAFTAKNGDLVIIVCLHERYKAKMKRRDIATLGLLLHECVHVVQRICTEVGEHSPSDEFQAYFTQKTFLSLASAIETAWFPNRKKGRG